MKKRVVIGAGLGLGLIGLGVGLAIWVAPTVRAVHLHDRQLDGMQAAIHALPHPRGSRRVDSLGGIGTYGDGYPYEMWAFEVRSFSGSTASLMKAYKGLRVAVPNPNLPGGTSVRSGTQDVEIEVLPSPLPSDYFIPVGAATGCRLWDYAGQKNLYLVKVINDGDPNKPDAKLDWWRCEVS